MTLYSVHLYREMRLTFERIEAKTSEAAAAIVRDGLSRDSRYRLGKHPLICYCATEDKVHYDDPFTRRLGKLHPR